MSHTAPQKATCREVETLASLGAAAANTAIGNAMQDPTWGRELERGSLRGGR